MKASSSPCLITLLWFSLATTVQADIVVIVPPQTSFDTLSTAEARQLFMAKSKTLPNGQTAVPLMHVEASRVRIGFDRQVLDRDPKLMRAYWAQMIFTGRGKPPRQLENDAAMKREVAATPNAIGYIDQRSLDSSVKAVLTINTD